MGNKSIIEVDIKQKTSSKRVLYGVIFPLCIFALFYCICGFELYNKLGILNAWKYLTPLVLFYAILSVYFKTHTTKTCASFEFCDAMIIYSESDIILGDNTYRISGIDKVKYKKKKLQIKGKIEKMGQTSITNLDSLTFELPIEEGIVDAILQIKAKQDEYVSILDMEIV